MWYKCGTKALVYLLQYFPAYQYVLCRIDTLTCFFAEIHQGQSLRHALADSQLFIHNSAGSCGIAWTPGCDPDIRKLGLDPVWNMAYWFCIRSALENNLAFKIPEADSNRGVLYFRSDHAGFMATGNKDARIKKNTKSSPINGTFKWSHERARDRSYPQISAASRLLYTDT